MEKKVLMEKKVPVVVVRRYGILEVLTIGVIIFACFMFGVNVGRK